MALAAPAKPTSIRLRFCKESNDLLYPREDKATRKLVFACRNCDYSEPAGDAEEDQCVYRNIIDHSAAEKTVILADVRTDPTLPRTRETTCPKLGCGERGAPRAAAFCFHRRRRSCVA